MGEGSSPEDDMLPPMQLKRQAQSKTLLKDPSDSHSSAPQPRLPSHCPSVSPHKLVVTVSVHLFLSSWI